MCPMGQIFHVYAKSENSKLKILFSYLQLTTGIESADFVFYISAMETERCQKGMTVAYAAHCQQESALDR